MPDNRREVVPEGIIEWLLEGDPAIRWQTKRDLLDAPLDDVASERARVATSGWGKRLLDRQDPTGTWAGGLYGPKWTSTAYTLLLLRHCGLAPGHPSALRAVEQIWDGARYFDGGLTPAASVDAPEACVTSMYLTLARYFGYDDARVEDAHRWLLANRLADGGWNCRTVRFGDRHSSFHTTILALEALARSAQRFPDDDEITAALVGGREFFLAHRLYKSHRHGTTVSPAFTKLSFPPRWHYDVLRGLEHFAATDAPWDDRYGDALEVVNRRRRSDGTWPVQNKHPGDVWFDMEKTGGPSRWNTLRALRVQRWAHSAIAGRPAPRSAAPPATSHADAQPRSASRDHTHSGPS